MFIVPVCILGDTSCMCHDELSNRESSEKYIRCLLFSTRSVISRKLNVACTQ